MDDRVGAPAAAIGRRTNKGRRFPPDPIRVEEVAKLLEACTPLVPGRYGYLSAIRLRTLIVLMYRTGLRISEVLALTEDDLIRQEMAIRVRRGRGGKPRIVAMDDWGWQELDRWLDARAKENVPGKAIICVLRSDKAGEPLSATDARRQLRMAGERAGLTRRINPDAFRQGFSVELYAEGVDLYRMQEQLGHARLDVTLKYVRGIQPIEVLEPIRRRSAPKVELPPPERHRPTGSIGRS